MTDASRAERTGGDERGRIVSIDARGAGSNGWLDDVQRPTMELLEEFSRHAAETRGDPVTVVLTVSPADTAGPLEEAMLQAARGVVGTAALEFASAGGRANTVITSSETAPEDTSAVVEYLFDESRGGYTTGATIDLRGESSVPVRPDGAVLITGAAGGLGFAAASAIQRSGRRVVLTDRAGEALDEAGRSLGAPTVACDLTRSDQLDRLVAAEEVDGVDTLVVHHGVGASSRLGEGYDFAGAERSLVLNGTTVHDIVERFLPKIRSARGGVVVLSSQAGLVAEEGNSAYCAAKFAAMGYVNALAARLKGDGVRVQGLCPGPVDTPLMRLGFTGQALGMGLDPEEFIRTRLSAIPLGRAGDADQIGASTALLLQLQATGVVLAPTGGETLS